MANRAHSRPSLLPYCKGIFVLALLLVGSLSVTSLQAQPDAMVSQLLFEPVPLPLEGPAPERELISFSAAEADIPPAAAAPVMSREDRRAKEADIERYLAVVGESEATAGPYSDQLREDLFSAGQLYQELDMHDQALRMFERTLGVSRINHGLEELDQVPILEAMAQSYLARKELSKADGMMESALNIQKKVYGENSIELVPALLKQGEWNTSAFMERSSILISIPRMNVQNFLTDPRNFIQPQEDIRNTPLFKLYQARVNYLNALRNLVNAHAYDHPDLLPLERELLTNFFLHMHRENILYEPDFYLTRKKTKTTSRLNQNAIEMMTSENYDLGRQAHKRSLTYLMNNPAVDGASLAQAMLEEADWDVLFQRKTVGFDKYKALLEFFAVNPALHEEAQAVLYPEVPVILPTYLPPPNSREKLGIKPDAEVHFFGYIDVSFALTKYGKARSIKILGKSGEITRNIEIRMNQYLRKLQYRPLFSELGINTDTIRLRYFVGI
jgi:tetratricopeptide (TPR) repeat protein